MGRRWVSRIVRLYGLCLYTLCLVVSVLFIVGSGGYLGKNKGGMIQCYFQGFHLFPGCLCASVVIESLRNLPVV